MSTATHGSFSLSCAKEDFKFSSAHFVAHGGGREKLHGHNYRVFVSLQGTRLGAEGVVMDFSELKRVVRALCKCVRARARARKPARRPPRPKDSPAYFFIIAHVQGV